jgi:hypothetical protein
MSTLKDTWKKVGDDIETIGKDLEKSIVKTVKQGAKVVSDWANKEDDDEKKDAPKADVVIDSEEKKE